ncbi:MAG TPA: hypothetical protein VFF73_40905 [Planctomycetota bacterium]|nr:hypothetical protein [Planctomycetota bacterium]
MPSIVHGCGAKLHFPSEMAGRKGRCPTCGQAVEVPIDSGIKEAPRAGLAPRPAVAPTVEKKMHLDPPPNWEQYQAFLDGKGPNPRPVIVPANLMLKDEAEAKWEAAVKKGAPSKFLCPGCRERLEVGAMVCMKCGLDLRSGKTVDGKTRLNESGMSYLQSITWLKNAPEDFDPAAEEDDDGKKPRFPNLRKKRPS